MKKYLAGPLLALASLSLALIAAEGVLRLTLYIQNEIMRTRHPPLCTQADGNPELIYRYVPNKCGNNSQGFRDREHTFEKPPGTFRIAIIGDSVAAGGNVELREVFGRVLERDLNERLPGRFEVIILARDGYSTSQELIILDEEAPKYDPDLILWSYVLNDPAHPLYHAANGQLGRYYYSPDIHLVHFVSKQLFMLRQRSRSRKCPKGYHAMLHCVYWNEVEAHFASMGDFVAKSGKPIVVVIHPVFEEGRDYTQYSLTELHERLRNLATAHALPVFDLLDAYRGHDPADLKNPGEGWFDPWHPNLEGHRVAGLAIANFLSENGSVSIRADERR